VLEVWVVAKVAVLVAAAEAPPVSNHNPRFYSKLLPAARKRLVRQCLSLNLGRYSMSTRPVTYHAAMVAIHAVYYNFAGIHKTLRITPSMAAGLSDHVWSLEEIVHMADSYAPKPGKRGPYKKK
jgi:hypothetical protein